MLSSGFARSSGNYCIVRIDVDPWPNFGRSQARPLPLSGWRKGLGTATGVVLFYSLCSSG